MKPILKDHKKLIIILATGFVLHSILAIIPPLNGDESTFWEWSRHLALGYYDHPPLTAWVVALFTNIFGTYKYSIRLAAIVLHLGTCIFIYCLSLDIIRKKEVALIAVTLYLLMPLSILFGTMMSTDVGLILCFTAATYFIKKAIIDQKKHYWYATAIACGGMLLTKFMAVLFPPGIFLFLLLNKKYRKQFQMKEPYIATLIALLIFSPFIYWNMNNHWLTFQFNFVVRQRNEGFALIKPFIYFAGQMLAASPVVFVVLLVVLVTFISHFTKNRNSKGLTGSNGDALLLLCYVIAFPLGYYFL
ncbi:glycosyltransferase family 39 protein, partial [bacterium]|nr:glycosyltransferase family 39 protein [bacterium]